MLRKESYIFFCLFTFLLLLPANICGQTTMIPDSLLHQPWDEREIVYHSRPWTEGCDSILSSRTFHEKTYYYNLDSIYYRIATREASEIVEDLRYFYFIVEFSTPAEHRVEREKLTEAIKRYKSKALERELDVFDAYTHFKSRDRLTTGIWDYYKNLIDKYERKGDLQTKLRIMHHLLYQASGYPTLNFTSRIEKEGVPVITLINESLATLERLDEPYLFGSNSFYTHIGLIYYDFKYYNKALPLLWKSLEQPSGHYYDRGVMRARDYLGDYYTMTGDYDRSDSLYLSILKSPERLAMRPIDNVVAIGALASNANRRGNKEEAERLYAIAMPQALQVKDSTLAGGYALHLGRLYMEKGDLDKTREMLDLGRRYLLTGGLPFRNWERFYTLSRDYYLKIDKADIAACYIDSISSIQAEKENIYNARVLAYAEQEAHETEKKLKEKQLREKRAQVLLVSAILVLALILLGILFVFNRKLQDKNRNLYIRIKAQDSVAARHEKLLLQKMSVSKDEELSAADRQRELFIRLYSYLLADRNFAKSEIDANALANRLSTNRSYLFEAIKTFTGKTLQEYINYLRLEDAKRMLETTDETVDDIALQCGYNSVRTFYRLFKTGYQISPTIYRKIAKEQESRLILQ